jgi:hypothetical protein
LQTEHSLNGIVAAMKYSSVLAAATFGAGVFAAPSPSKTVQERGILGEIGESGLPGLPKVPFSVGAPQVGGIFSVPQSLNPNFKANGPAAMYKAYNKYHIRINGTWAEFAQKWGKPKNPPKTVNSDGSVPANPETNDAEYLSPVTIDGQTLNLDFDTGSADL